MNEKSTTTAPIQAIDPVHVTPEFIRLPKPGTSCRWTGLSRSKLNELILPSKLNGFKPPVRSLSVRNRGQVRAARLIVLESLLSYLRGLLEQQTTGAMSLIEVSGSLGHEGDESESVKRESVTAHTETALGVGSTMVSN